MAKITVLPVQPQVPVVFKFKAGDLLVSKGDNNPCIYLLASAVGINFNYFVFADGRRVSYHREGGFPPEQYELFKGQVVLENANG